MRVGAALLFFGVLVSAFLALCFFTPTPAPRYTLFPGQPDWYKLDTKGLDTP